MLPWTTQNQNIYMGIYGVKRKVPYSIKGRMNVVNECGKFNIWGKVWNICIVYI